MLIVSVPVTFQIICCRRIPTSVSNLTSGASGYWSVGQRRRLILVIEPRGARLHSSVLAKGEASRLCSAELYPVLSSDYIYIENGNRRESQGTGAQLHLHHKRQRVKCIQSFINLFICNRLVILESKVLCCVSFEKGRGNCDLCSINHSPAPSSSQYHTCV